jgi:hypothetical protein
VVFREIEDGLDVLLRFVVREECRMWSVPGADDFFPLPMFILASIRLSTLAITE